MASLFNYIKLIFFKELENLIWDCTVFFYSILKNCRLTSTLKAFIWKKNVGSKNTYSARISASQDKHNKDMTMHTSNIANIHTYKCANRFLYTVRTWEHSSEITKTQTNCRQVEFHTVISWQVETKRRNTRGEGFLQIPLRGGEMEILLQEIWSFDAFGTLKITFRKHLLIIAPEVKKMIQQ